MVRTPDRSEETEDCFFFFFNIYFFNINAKMFMRDVASSS